MVIKTKLTKTDFINANMALLYKKNSTKIYAILGFLFFVLATYGFFLMQVDWMLYIKEYWFLYFVPFVLMFFYPIRTWITANINFSPNKRIAETIEYQFEKDFLVVKGESFSSQSTWKKVNKVTQTKNFIFIWQSSAAANIIPKKDIWEGDIIELKEILDSHGVKNTLKTQL